MHLPSISSSLPLVDPSVMGTMKWSATYTPDTLHLGCSCHLHPGQYILSTWGAIRLGKRKDKTIEWKLYPPRGVTGPMSLWIQSYGYLPCRTDSPTQYTPPTFEPTPPLYYICISLPLLLFVLYLFYLDSCLCYANSHFFQIRNFLHHAD